jgi:hypothetical protein
MSGLAKISFMLASIGPRPTTGSIPYRRGQPHIFVVSPASCVENSVLPLDLTAQPGQPNHRRLAQSPTTVLSTVFVVTRWPSSTLPHQGSLTRRNLRRNKGTRRRKSQSCTTDPNHIQTSPTLSSMTNSVNSWTLSWQERSVCAQSLATTSA